MLGNLHYGLNFDPGTARKYVLKLVKLRSLFAKCCKMREIYSLAKFATEIVCKCVILRCCLNRGERFGSLCLNQNLAYNANCLSKFLALTKYIYIYSCSI